MSYTLLWWSMKRRQSTLLNVKMRKFNFFFFGAKVRLWLIWWVHQYVLCILCFPPIFDDFSNQKCVWKVLWIMWFAFAALTCVLRFAANPIFPSFPFPTDSFVQQHQVLLLAFFDESAKKSLFSHKHQNTRCSSQIDPKAGKEDWVMLSTIKWGCKPVAEAKVS